MSWHPKRGNELAHGIRPKLPRDDRESEHIMIFSGGKHGSAEAHMEQYGINDERVLEIIDSSYMAQLYDDVELMDVAGNKFDLDAVSRGALTPSVFFGSARFELRC